MLSRGIVGTLRGAIGANGKRVLNLSGGAAAAQFIPLLIAPILTRLYSPQDYGMFAIFGSVVAVLGAVAAGRYTVAIMLPETDRSAIQVTGLAISIAASVSAFILLLVPLTIWLLSGIGIVGELGGWLYLVPFAVFLGSGFESLSYFALRGDKTGQIARAKVIKTVASGGAQLSLGLLGAAGSGLLCGSMLGLALGNNALVKVFVAGLRRHKLTVTQMRSMAHRYSNFPKFDLWSNLANVLSYNIIIVGVGAIYSTASLGQYALAYRFMALPSALIGVALGQVYLREAARLVSSRALALRLFNRTTVLLAAASLVPMLAILFWGPELFALAFGSEWRMSGVYATAMMPLVWIRFVVSPLSSVFYIYNRQRRLLVLQLFLLSLVISSMFLAYQFGWSLQTLLIVQSILMGSLYILILWLSRRVIVNSPPRESIAKSDDQ